LSKGLEPITSSEQSSRIIVTILNNADEVLEQKIKEYKELITNKDEVWKTDKEAVMQLESQITCCLKSLVSLLHNSEAFEQF